MSMCSYVYELVQPNKHTHLQTHTHTCILSQDVSQNPLSRATVQCWALQPQGEAPASSPARAGQAEHLAPQKGHHHPHPSTPIALLGVKEASPTLPIPSLPRIAPRVTHSHASTAHVL